MLSLGDEVYPLQLQVMKNGKVVVIWTTDGITHGQLSEVLA